jgi:hypothetical protein
MKRLRNARGSEKSVLHFLNLPLYPAISIRI